jgi:hypothetical protein
MGGANKAPPVLTVEAALSTMRDSNFFPAFQRHHEPTQLTRYYLSNLEGIRADDTMRGKTSHTSHTRTGRISICT